MSRVTEIGTDTTGLRWWSYIELQGRDNKRFIILSGYRVCENQTVDLDQGIKTQTHVPNSLATSPIESKAASEARIS